MPRRRSSTCRRRATIGSSRYGAARVFQPRNVTALGWPGLLPTPRLWSGSGLDRGHFIAHGAGGGLDLNLFPQLALLNRGWSRQGRLWRQLERYAARNPGTPLLVRPIYRDDSWRPSVLEFGLIIEDTFRVEGFIN